MPKSSDSHPLPDHLAAIVAAEPAVTVDFDQSGPQTHVYVDQAGRGATLDQAALNAALFTHAAEMRVFLDVVTAANTELADLERMAGDLARRIDTHGAKYAATLKAEPPEAAPLPVANGAEGRGLAMSPTTAQPEDRVERLLAHLARHGFKPSEIIKNGVETRTHESSACAKALHAEPCGPCELYVRHADYVGHYLLFLDTRAPSGVELVGDFACRGNDRDLARMNACMEEWRAIEEARPLSAREAVLAGAERDLAALVLRELSETERRHTSHENIVSTLRGLARLEARLRSSFGLGPSFPPSKWTFTPGADALASDARPSSDLVSFYSHDGHEVVVLTATEQAEFEREQGFRVRRDRRVDVPTFAALLAFAGAKRTPPQRDDGECVKSTSSLGYVRADLTDDLPKPASSRGPRV